MPKEQLTGTLEEQCDFLYDLAMQKTQDGNFTGAAHVLQEIVKHNPDYKDVVVLLDEVQRRKAEQRFLLMMGLVGLVVFVAIGSRLGLRNDLFLLVFAGLGAVVGYGAGNLIQSFRR